jgi:MipA family protein
VPLPTDFRRHSVALLISTLAAMPVRADDLDARANEGGTHWGLGLAIGAERSPYAGVKNRSFVFPLISYENRWVRLFGNQLDLKLPAAGAFEFALRATYSFDEGYKASDSPTLAGLAERKGGLRLGPVGIWRSPVAELSLEWLADASRHSKGQTLKFGAEHAYSLGGHLSLTPHIAAVWRDRKEVDYFFGVRPDEATVARRAYAGGATTSLEAGLRFSHAGRDSPHLLFVDLTATRWGSGITGSPLVGRKNSPAVRVGYVYRF